ncbi:HAD-IIIA family hydrolase [Thioalkalicoccus limnaeus]|uniref:3-deoxy-D-manno-octulosonate 8-phosphate phosphatase KdsC n=1 Tax=Thioalkalicoccus limnaeus TaxID=120681 RepID=A0ABV4BE45_9GAMM
MRDILERARPIRLALFDVDGVLTDGRLYFSDDGSELKAFFCRDGHGLVMLQQTGVAVGVITGRRSKAVERRMAELGIDRLYQGCRDKLPTYEQLRKELQLDDRCIAYVGDDLVDLPVMQRVGLAVAPADADRRVVAQAHWQTPSAGGRGAAREVCELIMEAQGTLPH